MLVVDGIGRAGIYFCICFCICSYIYIISKFLSFPFLPFPSQSIPYIAYITNHNLMKKKKKSPPPQKNP
ncbi:hypothetical protein EYC80_000268 [Monilinia laxa]|uniref:Uncharacterized protein n=1 Tax=Monilinia laxa TaxID=61186 RepID=A0A5N6KB69_MONLA|nr:hypothetical protein EYC80_000268 [Monilinia laxa]